MRTRDRSARLARARAARRRPIGCACALGSHAQRRCGPKNDLGRAALPRRQTSRAGPGMRTRDRRARLARARAARRRPIGCACALGTHAHVATEAPRPTAGVIAAVVCAAMFGDGPIVYACTDGEDYAMAPGCARYVLWRMPSPVDALASPAPVRTPASADPTSTLLPPPLSMPPRVPVSAAATVACRSISAGTAPTARALWTHQSSRSRHTFLLTQPLSRATQCR